MLQADEVDEDYFTPLQSTPLANIFSETLKTQESLGNESLKYSPPRQQNTIQKSDDSKMTQCIFACAVTGHEWLNNIYESKGKLGLAIIKINKTDTHNIVLYDANKTTVSCTSISTKLEVNVNTNHVLYYDNLRKYWCIYASDEEITKLVELLQSLNVILNYNFNKEDCPPKSAENCTETVSISDKITKDIGSDTDSSIYRKTKSSILNRMAMMGHSVLPSQMNVNEKTSDSSDNSDSLVQSKLVRHKPIKNLLKKPLLEKCNVSSDPQKIPDSQEKVLVHKRDQLSEQYSLYTNNERVHIPVSNPCLGKNSNGFDFFTIEQRITNSELRINLNRLTDKVDCIAEKINSLEHKDVHYSSNPFQIEILKKLILEYEIKIKAYEEYLKSKGINEVLLIAQESTESLSHAVSNNDIKTMQNQIKELKQTIHDKDNEVTRCQNEIQNLVEKLNQQSFLYDSNADLLKKIDDMEQILCRKNEEISQISQSYKSVLDKTEKNDTEKLKMIMNETFSVVASNFENGKVYNGDLIKKTLAGVIRKVTTDFISSS